MFTVNYLIKLKNLEIIPTHKLLYDVTMNGHLTVRAYNIIAPKNYLKLKHNTFTTVYILFANNNGSRHAKLDILHIH